MDQAFHAFLDLNKCPVRNEIGDLAFDALAGREPFLDLIPRILLSLFKSQRHALLFLVDVEHDDF